MNNNGLDSVSYDQYTNFPKDDKSRIIFSEKALEKVEELLAFSTYFSREYGCFFLGIESKQNPDVILVDYVAKQLFNSENDAVYPSEKQEKEIIDKYQEYEKNGSKPHIIHYHIHPKRKHFEAFSDNDYISYAYWSARCSGLRSYGFLATPTLDSDTDTGKILQTQTADNPNNDFNLNVVIAENGKDEPESWYSADFYSCPNIYYIKGNEIMEFGSYQKNFLTRKYAEQGKFDYKKQGRIVRNYGNYNGNNTITAIGHDPFGQKLVDRSIGYVDVNELFYIPEVGQFAFPSLPVKIKNQSTKNPRIR